MTDNSRKRIRIGDVLVESGVIKDTDVQKALAYSKEMNVKLGQAVVGLGLASEADICNALGQQLQMPVFSDLSKITIDSNVVQLIPENLARSKRVLAISARNDEQTGRRVISVLIADPLDYPTRDEIVDKLDPSEVEFIIAPESEIIRYLSQLYRNTESIARYADQCKNQILILVIYCLLMMMVVMLRLLICCVPSLKMPCNVMHQIFISSRMKKSYVLDSV